ncbi:LysM peptidoglycan-binding domain-containing protein [Psychromonas sp. KJ10-2]|uniref:LysM peptidoglycan-binding domain-containing protein n=1 Tax=Psychromonas sp. KJ10-2 TaxID=3391822 RepID=UPI0039B4405B
MQSFLIRTGDYFVNLNKRSEIARKGKADFLVSIHADGFTSSRPKGASVWVLSNRRATTELGRWMEKNEAQSQLLGGAGDLIQDSDSVPFLNKMLLDMSMGNTMGVGYNIGSLVTSELSKVTTMHKKEPVHASLAVLKSPDIPSILVEAGFITNPTEERLLNQAAFQNKIANAVFKGIYKHFSLKPPQGTLFAQKKHATKHTVRSGESLSILSKRYSVSAAKLKSFNHLKSSSLKIGQVLSIPENYQVVVEPQSQVTSARPLVQQATTHTVKRGESLSVIASRYGKTTAQLVAYNNLSNTTLAVGQKIEIPGVGGNAQNTQTIVVKTPVVHTVARGEYLSAIAKKYNKSIKQLSSYNKLSSTTLRIGQRIKIPGAYTETTKTRVIEPKVAPKAPAPVVKHKIYTVRSGDSLSVIAERYATNMSNLKRINNLKSSSVYVGQKLKVPAGQVEAAPERLHVVKKGEFLSLIAKKFDTSISTLKSYNNLKSTSLRVGQKIKIPGADSSNYQSPVAKKVVVPTEHKVKRGESLSVIAQRYDRSAKQFQAYNKLSSTRLSVGQVLKIPSANYSAPVRPATHTVQKANLCLLLQVDMACLHNS